MSNEEINEAIAGHLGFDWWAVEKCGWWYREGGCGYTNRLSEAGRYTKEAAEKELVRGELMSIKRIPYPDYCNDLNAVAEAEKFLVEADDGLHWGCQRYQYARDLYDLVTPDRQPFMATARQRAEAFLRTVGKWRE